MQSNFYHHSTEENQRMQRIKTIHKGMITRGLAALFLGCTMFLATGHAISADATVKTTGGIPHVSGGIGEDSLAKMETMAKDFNLKLVFALQSGNYVTDVQVAIADAKGKTLLQSTSMGPWFLVSLPPGSYQVTATFSGKDIKRSVTVSKAKLQTVDFRWAAE
jgi:hypothetical protein